MKALKVVSIEIKNYNITNYKSKKESLYRLNVETF